LEKFYYKNKEGIYKHLYLFANNADRFIYKHYRYIVLDGVYEFTGIAYKTILRFVEADSALAFRAAEYIE